ncbi:MAG: nucleoside phosphorylase [Bacteroidales bacterium]|nr:nucleoside phosphorylase [Bacteroidales bacterium]
MKKIKESELIINPDGSIYHLRLRPEQLADTVIIVGDPQRVAVVSNYFDTIEYKIQNRELISHTGYLNNKRLTVLSTGMGTDNLDIVVNELDAIVNIDFNTRKIKERKISLNIIRLGTSGAFQGDIPVNTFIASEYGLGLDGLLNFYNPEKNIFKDNISQAFIQHSKWPDNLPKPYVVKCSEKLIKKLGKDMLKGITATAPGFYGPQGRKLRLDLAYPELYKKIETFNFKGNKIVNFEMETSALYGLGSLLGHNTLTVCVAIANRITQKYNKDYKKTVVKLIELILEKITQLD